MVGVGGGGKGEGEGAGPEGAHGEAGRGVERRRRTSTGEARTRGRTCTLEVIRRRAWVPLGDVDVQGSDLLTEVELGLAEERGSVVVEGNGTQEDGNGTILMSVRLTLGSTADGEDERAAVLMHEALTLANERVHVGGDFLALDGNSNNEGRLREMLVESPKACLEIVVDECVIDMARSWWDGR